ncbi:MAG: hypothetical protein JO257_21360 [Deltaproteobacteria bacterium]|nr:hypothetical protein [Deltaproteobacteria bacterium]
MKRHPYGTLLSIFVAYATAWTVLEPVVSFLDLTQSLGSARFAAFLAIAFAIGVGRMAAQRAATIKIPGTNATVHVEEGDLVSFAGHRIVSANEYFDCQLGRHVAKESIHGQIIDHEFGGSAELFERAVDVALEGVAAEDASRSSGRKKRYPIGTVAPVHHGPNIIFLVALSHTDANTLKATATSSDLWHVLRSVWEAVRVHSNGRPVAMALMGTGNAGIGLPYTKALEFILLSLLDESRRNTIPTEIRVMAPASVIASMDLGTVEESWKV